MNTRRFFLLAAASFTASTLVAGCGSSPTVTSSSPSATTAASTTAAKETIKVGVSPVPAGDILKFVKNNLAAEAGLDIQITEFNDGVQPNIALKEGQIDANYFQHVPYMEEFGRKHGFKMVALNPPIHLNPVGIFSKRYKSLSDVPQNALVSIPNDASNAYRSLKVLEASGLIKLKQTSGQVASVKDIVENPKNLKFKEIPGAQAIGSLPDVDLAGITGNWVLQSGMKTDRDALAIESAKDPIYAVTVTTLEGKETDPRVQKLYKLLRDDRVKEFIKQKYQGAVIPIP